MKTRADYNETERYIRLYNSISNRNLKELLKTLEASSLKRKDTYNKIDAIKTLLL